MDEVLLLLQVIQWERSQKKKKKETKSKKPRMITIQGDGYEKVEEGQPPALRIGMKS